MRLSAGDDLRGIAGVGLKTADGRIVPLGDVADLKLAEGPAQISRTDGSRRTTVEMNVHGRDSVGFVREAAAVLERELPLPDGYHARWGGQFEHYEEAKARLLVVVPLALGLILFLLFLAFDAAPSALLIFLEVPFAVTGGVAGLAVRGLPFSVSAAIGFIALFGVAVLNGLVLLSVAHRYEGEGPGRAASARRLAAAPVSPRPPRAFSPQTSRGGRS